MLKSRKWIALIVLSVLGYFAINRFTSSNDQNIGSSKLRFLSLAWQQQSINANKHIVDEWNKMNPDQEVEYIQESWNSVHDYLITSFETGDVPDVFHYESMIIKDFATRGFLVDMAPLISETMKNDIIDVAWASVTSPNGEISGIPFLAETYIGLYNKDIFEANKIEPPTFDNPWTWEKARDVGIQLTQDVDMDGEIDRWGIGMGLRISAALVMQHSVSFGGSFFHKISGKYIVRVGEEEKALLRFISDMYHVDKCMSPESISNSGAEIISGFLRGRNAMIIGIGAGYRQQIVENAPEGFHWGVMPPLKSKSQNIGTNTQTLSIPIKSTRKDDAMKFVTFFLNSENMATLALNDWMMPTRISTMAKPQFQTEDDGWNIVTQSKKFLTAPPWIGFPGFLEWKGRVANPILQEFFSGRLTVEEAAERIEFESNIVLSRYQLRHGNQ